MSRWLACLALGGAILLLPFAGLGVSAPTLAATCACIVLFIALPGVAVLARTRWMAGNPLVFCAWCAGAGLALQPLWLTPLWMCGATRLAWIVPVASLAALAPVARPLAAYVDSGMRARPLSAWLAWVAGASLFVAATACLGVMFPFATVPLDPHFGTQGSIVRNLADGWPPMNQLLEGVPLSYNYGVHLGLLLLVQAGHVDLLQLVARVAPLLFLEATIVVFMAFGRSVLALPWAAVCAAVVAVFWVVGFGPVNAALYGSVLPSASTYVVSSLGAFIVFLVALRFLAARGAVTRGRAAAAGAALAFSITALRGQGGPVWLAVTAFACVMPWPRERRIDATALAVLAGSAAGLLLALRVFFTLGAGFSGTSFLHVGTTFGWLADQHAFTLVDALRGRGAGPWAAGAAGFALIALMQSKFLAPAFAYALARPRGATRPVWLLAATALAGASATMLTSAPGGSHFSFMHYATLAMGLLGAAGLAHALDRAADVPARVRIAVVAACGLLAIPSAWDLAVQLRRLEGRWLAGPPVIHAMPQVDPLLDRIPPDALVVPFLRAADQVPGVEAEWGMRHGLRFAIYSSLLTEYAAWENQLTPALRHRVAAATAIDRALLIPRLGADDLQALWATLAHPQAIYVIAPAEAVAAPDPRLRAIASTKAYTLYFFQPAGRSGP